MPGGDTVVGRSRRREGSAGPATASPQTRHGVVDEISRALSTGVLDRRSGMLMARRPHPIHRLPEARRHAKTVCRPFERTPCVRNVLTTSSTEVPEEASECVVGIHSRLPSSIGVPLTTVLSPSLGCLSSPSPQRAVPCSPWLRAAPAAPGAGLPAHAQRSASAGGRPPSTTMMATRSVHVSWHSWVTQRPSVPSRSAAPPSRHRTPAAHASLTSFHPPYAAVVAAPRPAFPGVPPAARAPATAAARPYRRRARRPAHRYLRTQSQRQPCTPKIATTRGTPAAAAPAHQRRPRTPTAVRRLPAARRR